MKPERVTELFNRINDKYVGRALNRNTVMQIYSDFSATVQMLHNEENFLNVRIDHNSKVMLVEDEETMNYLGLLPYLDNTLMKTKEVYTVYLLKGNEAHTQCAVSFEDAYNGSEIESKIGFELNVMPIIPLGMFYPDTNEFREWRKE